MEYDLLPSDHHRRCPKIILVLLFFFAAPAWARPCSKDWEERFYLEKIARMAKEVPATLLLPGHYSITSIDAYFSGPTDMEERKVISRAYMRNGSTQMQCYEGKPVEVDPLTPPNPIHEGAGYNTGITFPWMIKSSAKNLEFGSWGEFEFFFQATFLSMRWFPIALPALKTQKALSEGKTEKWFQVDDWNYILFIQKEDPARTIKLRIAFHRTSSP